MARVPTTVWTISPELVSALDAAFGTPVDSYVNGSQTWLVDVPGHDDLTLEFRLHPVGGYRPPTGLSHYDLWETVTGALAAGGDPHAIVLGDETRPLTGLWDGLEAFVAFGDELEPQTLAATATTLLGRAPDRVGVVDHEAVGDAWERAGGQVSIVALLLEQLAG